MTTPVPPVRVAGLEIPAQLADRIIEALRSQYPSLTEVQPDDDAAVRAVLLYWISSALESYESSKATEELNASLAAVRTKHEAKLGQMRAARQAALSMIKQG